MNNDDKPGLDDAYAVETPEDSIRLYANWASTYESEFVANNGYVGFLRVVEQLADRLTDFDAEIIDVGCGTGVCGRALAELGFNTIDGIDISAEMLAEAGKKARDDGRAVYRNLQQADLTGRVAIEDGAYRALVCAGTFTHGHLGPESLDVLWRIAAPGAICSVGINANHYKEAGFATKIADDDARGIISLLDVVDIETYETPQDDVTPGNDKSKVLVCRAN